MPQSEARFEQCFGHACCHGCQLQRRSAHDSMSQLEHLQKPWSLQRSRTLLQAGTGPVPASTSSSRARRTASVALSGRAWAPRELSTRVLKAAKRGNLRGVRWYCRLEAGMLGSSCPLSPSMKDGPAPLPVREHARVSSHGPKVQNWDQYCTGECEGLHEGLMMAEHRWLERLVRQGCRRGRTWSIEGRPDSLEKACGQQA